MVAETRILEDTNDLSITGLPQYPICYVRRTGHPYAERREIDLIDIFDFPIATPWIPEMIYKLVARETGLSMDELTAFKNGLIECSYFKLLTDVVLTSNAIGCGLIPIFADAINRKKLVQLPVTNADVTSMYGFVTLGNYTLSPAIQILRQILIESVQKMNDSVY